MRQELLTQLAEYGTYCDELQASVPSEEVEEIVESISSTSEFGYTGETRHLWLAGVAAAVFVLVGLGGVAWLAQSGGQTPPAAEEPVATTGDGPRLSFVQAVAPTDDLLQAGAWFKGALYVVSDRHLFRSSNGLTWESLPGLPDSGEFGKLQTDGDRLVNVAMPNVGSAGIRNDAFIQIDTSTDGVDWVSSRISVPVPAESGVAGEFRLVPNFGSSDHFAVTGGGIVVTATISLGLVADGVAMELTGMADNNEGIETEVVDLDLDGGVMIVRLWDAENDTGQVGEDIEIDLHAAGFTSAFSNLLDALAADPEWAPLVDRFKSQFTATHHDAEAEVGYAWFSPDGLTWQEVDKTGPLDGGHFQSLLATRDGFVTTASGAIDHRVVWQSADGVEWTSANGLTSKSGTDHGVLVEWQGELIEHVGTTSDGQDEPETWTLATPVRRVFPDLPIRGLNLHISDFGLIGTPSSGFSGPDATELLFSADGAGWNRWVPTEFSIGGSHDSPGEHMGDAWIVGVGDDFVVLQHRQWNDETETLDHTLWVGTIE